MGRRLVPTILLLVLPATALADALSSERVSAWLAERASAHFASLADADGVGGAIGDVVGPFADSALERDVVAVYGKARGRLLFLEDGVLTSLGEEAIALLRDVERHGAGAAPYALEALETRVRRYQTSLATFRRPRATWAAPEGWTPPAPKTRLSPELADALARAQTGAERHVAVARELDVHIAAGLTRLVRDLELADGRSAGEHADVVLALAKAPRAELRARLPRHPQYDRVGEAMLRYLALWRGPAAAPVPEDVPIVRGDRSSAVALLRARLAWEGFLPEAGTALFDGETEAALRRFQRSRGLPETGVADGPTRVAMNRPPAWWVRRLAFALARWRSSVTRDFDGTYVRVNVPEFRLEVREEGEETFSMDVLVGQPQTPTYEVQSVLKEIRVNPSWNVPPGVQRREIEPRAAQDPAFLEDNHFVRSRRGGRYIQKPGPWNWLGRAIIPFFNRKGLALHGSLRDHLMGEAQRAYSNGCVNLADEVTFVRFLLQREKNPALAQLDGWLDGWKTHRIRLRKPLPLVIEYQTVTVDPDGLVRFLPDIYRKDGAVLARVSVDPFSHSGVATQP